MGTLQGQSLQFNTLTVNDGLNANSVNDVIRDKQGFMWVATSDGVCRYDGHSYKQYHFDKYKPNSLNSFIYIQLLEDDYGNIWLDGENGIEVIEAKTGNVKMVFETDNSNNILPQYSFFKTNNPNIIIHLSSSFKISYFNTKTLTYIDSAAINFIPNKLKIETYKYLNLAPFTKSEKDTLFLLSVLNEKLYKFCIKNKTVTEVKIDKNNDLVISSLPKELDKNHIAFVAIRKNAQLLIVFNLTTYSIEKEFQITTINENLNPLSISNLLVTKNKFYMGIHGIGLFEYNRNFTLLNKYVYEPTNSKSISGNLFFSCIKEINNELWVSPNPSGLSVANMDGGKFYNYKSNIGIADLSKGVFTDKKGNVYNMPLGIGVKYYDCKTGLNFTNTLPTHIQKLFSKVEYASFNNTIKLNNEEVLIYTPNNFLLYNHEKFTYIDYMPFFKKSYPAKNMLRYCSIFAIAERKLLIELNDVLHEVDLKSDGTFTITKSQKFENVISAVLKTKAGKVIVGSPNGVFINEKDFANPVGIAETKNKLVKCLLETKNNIIYAATLGGVFVFKESGKLLHHFTTANGLSNNFCYGLLEDTLGNIWISNNMGLNKYNPQKNTFTYYTIADGLQGNEFNSGAYYKNENGIIYFGGIYGVSAANPLLLEKNATLPKPVLTALAINDTWINRDTSIWNIPIWKLKHNQNTITLEFASMKILNNASTLYEYKLEGFDKDWVKNGSVNIVRYPDLPPGKYQFFIRTKQNEIERSAELLVTIVIEPAFYQTKLFIAFLILLFGYILWNLFQYQSKQKYKKQLEQFKLQQELEIERQRISRDLHDNMGAYTNALLTNVQKLKSKDGNTEDVKIMQNNAENILSSLRETIWVLNNKETTLVEFSDGFKDYCFKILRNFDTINFETTESIIDNILLPAKTAIHLNKILQEGIQNILKHAQATEINYGINCTQNNLQIILIDNGIGYDDGLIKKGNGLDNMKWRSNEANIDCNLKSEINKGTEINIIINF